MHDLRVSQQKMEFCKHLNFRDKSLILEIPSLRNFQNHSSYHGLGDASWSV